MRRQTSWKLAEMKRDEKFAGVDWKMLNEYLPDKLLEELDEENNTDFHRQLSTKTHEDSSENPQTGYELLTIPLLIRPIQCQQVH